MSCTNILCNRISYEDWYICDIHDGLGVQWRMQRNSAFLECNSLTSTWQPKKHSLNRLIDCIWFGDTLPAIRSHIIQSSKKTRPVARHPQVLPMYTPHCIGTLDDLKWLYCQTVVVVCACSAKICQTADFCYIIWSTSQTLNYVCQFIISSRKWWKCT